jgi:hypothetical protein
MKPHLMLALLASPSPWTKGGLPEAEKETVAVLGIAPGELVRERELENREIMAAPSRGRGIKSTVRCRGGSLVAERD